MHEFIHNIEPGESHLIVTIGDTTFDTWRHPGLIAHASVELTVDKSGDANVSILDPDFKYTDMFLDSTGMKQLEVKIWMGYDKIIEISPTDNPQQVTRETPPLFTGLLTRHNWESNISTFTFDDLTSKMKQRKHNRYHNRTTDLKLLKKLAEEHGLKFVVNQNVPDSQEHDVVMQFEQTDWQFAREIAQRLGLRLYERNGTLYAQEAGHKGAVVAELTYKKDSGDFVMLRGMGLNHKLPENRRGRPGSYEVRGRGRAGSRLSATDGADNVRGTRQVSVDDIGSNHEARRRARARRNLRREDAFEHSINLLPSFLARSIPLNQGETIRLKNIGGFYSGEYVIRTASYIFRPGAFTCELTLRRDIAGLRRRRRR